MNNDLKDDEINSLLSLDEDELFYRLGLKVDIRGFAVSSNNEKEDVTYKGKVWFSKEKQMIKKIICESRQLKMILSHETKVALTRAVADLIAHHFIGFPAVEISAILCRFGINKICNEK